MSDFLLEVRRFLVQNRMAETRFGREFVGDPGFVGALKKGRVPRQATRDRITAKMAQFEQNQ